MKVISANPAAASMIGKYPPLAIPKTAAISSVHIMASKNLFLSFTNSTVSFASSESFDGSM